MNVGQNMWFLGYLLFSLVPIAANAAQTVDFGADLCGAGSMMVDGTCTTSARGKCPDGYYQINADATTFSGSIAGGQCTGAYTPADFSDSFHTIYSGTVVAFGATLCGAGKYMANGTCKSYEQGECPSDFYKMMSDSATMIPTDLGACKSEYTVYDTAMDCAQGVAENGMCAVLCDAGMKYTGLGTCAQPCTAGITKLKTSTGISLPLYARRQTTPSLVVQTASGTCYVNAMPGAGTNTINILGADNDAYHLTD